MHRTLRGLTLVVVLTVVLAPVGTASRAPGIDSTTCSLSAGTTFSYIAGTTVVDYEFDRADRTATEVGTITNTSKGLKAGSVTVATPADAATVTTTFGNKRGPAGRPPATACTA